MNILLVDDDYVDLINIKRHLKNENYVILTANTGLDALDIIRNTSSLDLVLLDAIMPGLSGFETCLKIQQLNQNLPVILVTGLTDEKFLKQAFDSGAADFISKPVNKQELISRINNILKIKNAEKEIQKLYSNLLSDLKIANSVQSYLIPDWINIYDNLVMTSSFIPVASVSGDLFELIPLDNNKFLTYIGDISGHGVQASLIMAAIQMAIRLEVMDHKQNVEIIHVLNKLNSIFSERFPDSSYMTFLIGIIDLNKNSFEYFSAGHPPVIIYNNQTGSVNTYKEKGSLPIGMFPDIDYNETDMDFLDLNENTSILLYTDGLFECTTKNNEIFDLISMLSVFSDNRFFSKFSLPEELINYLYKENFLFDDDVTVLLISTFSKKHSRKIFIIEPSLEEVCLLSNKLIDVLHNHNIGKDIIFAFEILLKEHLNNIVIHGYKAETKSKLEKIFLSINIAEDKIIITTLDKGMAWNFNDHQKSRENEQLTDYKISGRGLDIINSIAEKVSYKRINCLNEAVIVVDAITLKKF